MKKWSDESLVKCFAGKLGGVFIKEDEEVAEARVSFLEKKKRYILHMFGSNITRFKKVCVMYWHGRLQTNVIRPYP